MSHKCVLWQCVVRLKRDRKAWQGGIALLFRDASSNQRKKTRPRQRVATTHGRPRGRARRRPTPAAKCEFAAARCDDRRRSKMGAVSAEGDRPRGCRGEVRSCPRRPSIDAEVTSSASKNSATAMFPNVAKQGTAGITILRTDATILWRAPISHGRQQRPEKNSDARRGDPARSIRRGARPSPRRGARKQRRHAAVLRRPGRPHASPRRGRSSRSAPRRRRAVAALAPSPRRPTRRRAELKSGARARQVAPSSTRAAAPGGALPTHLFCHQEPRVYSFRSSGRDLFLSKQSSSCVA